MIRPCLLCGTPREEAQRCPECNLAPGVGPDATSPFRSGTLWGMVGGLAVVFAITLVVVALAR